MTTVIYALVDPRTHEVRYVGKTRNFRARMQKHRQQVEETRKGVWVSELRENGHTLFPVKLAEVDDIHADAAEQFWIAQGRLFGWALTNTTHNGRAHAPGESEQLPLEADTSTEVIHEPEAQSSIVCESSEAPVAPPYSMTVDWPAVTAEDAARIVDLFKQGVSRNSICAIVYQAKTPRTQRMVNSVLRRAGLINRLIETEVS